MSLNNINNDIISSKSLHSSQICLDRLKVNEAHIRQPVVTDADAKLHINANIAQYAIKGIPELIAVRVRKAML